LIIGGSGKRKKGKKGMPHFLQLKKNLKKTTEEGRPFGKDGGGKGKNQFPLVSLNEQC